MAKILKKSDGEQLRNKKSGLPKGLNVREVADRFGKEADSKRPRGFKYS